MTDLDVLLGGKVFCDLVFSGSALSSPGAEVFADGLLLSPGGTADRAVASARLGGRTGLLAVVGHDVLGNELVRQLADEPGLDLSWVRRHTDVHTAVTVAVTDEHDRSSISHEEVGTEVLRVCPGTLASAATCHVGIASAPCSWPASNRGRRTDAYQPDRDDVEPRPADGCSPSRPSSRCSGSCCPL